MYYNDKQYGGIIGCMDEKKLKFSFVIVGISG